MSNSNTQKKDYVYMSSSLILRLLLLPICKINQEINSKKIINQELLKWLGMNVDRKNKIENKRLTTDISSQTKIIDLVFKCISSFKPYFNIETRQLIQCYICRYLYSKISNIPFLLVNLKKVKEFCEVNKRSCGMKSFFDLTFKFTDRKKLNQQLPHKCGNDENSKIYCLTHALMDLPRYLLLALNRFKFRSSSNNSSFSDVYDIDTTGFNIPLMMNLSDYFETKLINMFSDDNSSKEKDWKYKLLGVVCVDFNKADNTIKSMALYIPKEIKEETYTNPSSTLFPKKSILARKAHEDDEDLQGLQVISSITPSEWRKYVEDSDESLEVKGKDLEMLTNGLNGEESKWLPYIVLYELYSQPFEKEKYIKKQIEEIKEEPTTTKIKIETNEKKNEEEKTIKDVEDKQKIKNEFNQILETFQERLIESENGIIDNEISDNETYDMGILCPSAHYFEYLKKLFFQNYENHSILNYEINVVKNYFPSTYSRCWSIGLNALRKYITSKSPLLSTDLIKIHPAELVQNTPSSPGIISSTSSSLSTSRFSSPSSPSTSSPSPSSLHIPKSQSDIILEYILSLPRIKYDIMILIQKLVRTTCYLIYKKIIDIGSGEVSISSDRHEDRALDFLYYEPWFIPEAFQIFGEKINNLGLIITVVNFVYNTIDLGIFGVVSTLHNFVNEKLLKKLLKKGHGMENYIFI
jgi:hypothetical protein